MNYRLRVRRLETKQHRKTRVSVSGLHPGCSKARFSRDYGWGHSGRLSPFPGVSSGALEVKGYFVPSLLCWSIRGWCRCFRHRLRDVGRSVKRFSSLRLGRTVPRFVVGGLIPWSSLWCVCSVPAVAGGGTSRE